MSKRPPSPSNIPVLRQSSESPSRKSRTPRKLPEALVAAAPSSTMIPGAESKLRTPTFGKKPKSPIIKTRSNGHQYISSEDVHTNGLAENNNQKSGVIYITENLIRKMSKEDNFYRIFKLDLTLSKSLNKKIRYIENLEPLKNLQILSLAHNAIEKIEHLSKLVNLQILDLSDNKIRNIEGIEALQQLNVLNLEDNLIETLPSFIGKKLKCLRTFKIARNQINSLHELYKLRLLPDLVEISIEGNPMCTLEHHRQMANFLLRSLEVLDAEPVTEEERREADDRFSQEEVCHLENELHTLEKRLAEVEAERDRAEEFGEMTKQSETQLKKNNDQLKQNLSTLQKSIEMKDNLLKNKTIELSKACEKQFKLEQELAFYKLDTKFDELWKFQGYQREDSEDEYIDEDQSAYIGKARFKPNSLARELVLPSKAQMMNLIKLTKQNNKQSQEINQTIIHDLQEALDIDLQEKQDAIAQAEKELEKVKEELANGKNKIRDMNENMVFPTQVDGAVPLSNIADREKVRAKLLDFINQAKEMEETIQELEDKLNSAQQALNDKEEQLEKLKEEQDAVFPDNPDQEKLIDEIAAKEEQCYQMSEFVEQLTNLLHESQAELEDKVEVIKALELRLKLGEPDVQSEMKTGLEDMVKKLTKHLEELKSQMKEQKSVIVGLEKEKKLLKRKIEQLENDVMQGDNLAGDIEDISARLREKENALQEEIENNEKISEAYESLMKKMNKKKRHVGIGSHDVWRDPALENLENQMQRSQDENEKLHQAIERINKQREAERKAFEEKLEHGQAELESAVMSARVAGDFEREARELGQQVQKLKAERAGLKQRIESLEDDLKREKDESVPWKNILRQLQSISDEMDGGKIGRQSPSTGPSMKDKKLQRLFEDLRDKMNESLRKNEQEKNAIIQELQKLRAEVEELGEQLDDSQKELLKANRLCREAEQDAEDTKEVLQQTEARLKKALQDRSNNAALVEQELDALQSQLEKAKQDSARSKKESNMLRAELEDLQARLAASNKHAREVEQELRTVNDDFEEAKEKLKNDLEKIKNQMRKGEEENDRLNDVISNLEGRLAKMRKIEDENDRLKDAVKNLEGLLNKANSDLNAMQKRLNEAEKRMRKAENNKKELEFQLEAKASNENKLKSEIEALRDKLQKEKTKQKDEINALRKKAAKIEQEFADEIQFLKQQATEDRKLIEFLKNELKKDREDHKNEVDFLSEENSQLQEDLLQQQMQLQKAEENNERLLKTIARLEDDNNALNDLCNDIQKEAIAVLENEREFHEKELRGLKADIENLQIQFQKKVNNDDHALMDLLSRDIDNLRKKLNTADRQNRMHMEESHLAKSRLEDENTSLRHRLKDEINNAQNQISDLKRALAERESEITAVKNTTDPLLIEYRNKIDKLLTDLQMKNDELDGLNQKLQDFRNRSGLSLHALASQIEDIKQALSKIDLNSRNIIIPNYSNVPQQPPSHVIFNGTTNPHISLPSSSISNGQVHHYYHDIDRNLGPIIASSIPASGSVNVHHHHHNSEKSNVKKKRKQRIKYSDEYCNIPEHEDMSDEVANLTDRLQAAKMSKSRIIDESSPLKLELKHLESKVEDAVMMRTQRRQIGRNFKDTTY